MGKFLNALKDLSASVNGKTSEARTVVTAVKEIATGLTGQDAEGKNLTEVLEFAAQNYDDLDLQDKTVTPTTESQEVTADMGYEGLGTVTVEAVTSAIDTNITAGNIKKDVEILGVTGTYEGSGGDTQAEFLALKNIFETDFNLVIESENLDDLIAEVNSYFDTTKVIPLNSTLSATAFKNVLQKYLGTLDIDLANNDIVSLGFGGNDGAVIIEITNSENLQSVIETVVYSSGSNYGLFSTTLNLTPPITNLEDILNNQDVINYLNSGLLTYLGEGVSNGLNIALADVACHTSDLEIEEKRVKPTDILSMFTAPNPNVE